MSTKASPRTYAEKHAQANREAVATVVALAVTIACWVALGFGLASVDMRIAGLPLWVIGATVGVYAVSIVVVVVLRRFFFVDFDLEDEADG